MNTEFYDVVIVGTGAAGLFAALSLPPELRILMITKDAVENSDSYLAQGGICVLKTPDDYKSYFEDTMKAGRYENNKESVEIMIRSSSRMIERLMDYGVEFERDADGGLLYTREGAHSACRILYHKDVTGKEITSRLIQAVEKRKNITIREYETMTDLIVENGRCTGILAADREQRLRTYLSSSVILATGGLGGLFINSTNFPHITGDSLAIALKHEIELENIQYIQIHPTTLYSKKEGRRFLISESVRGEGAVLLNEKGERFVDELLPRDVVTEAIRREMERFGTEYVYLDLTRMPKEEIIHRFPNIYERCLEEGYDLSKDYVPVTPAQHYLMGGIKVGTRGETSLKGLYAVGETACNGVHGANRLASNSLLESLVFADRAAADIASHIDALGAGLEETAANLVARTDNYVNPYTEKAASVSDYPDARAREAAYRELIMNEIKRRDGDFYAKWCDHEN